MEYDWEAVWERRDGQLYESSLKFDALATTTDPSKVDIAVEDLQRIGTIVITLTQGTTKGSRRQPEIEVFTRVKGKVMENGGFITSVTTAKSIKRKEWPPVFYDFTPEGNGMPYHRFVFNYRPRRVLEFIGKFEGDEASIDFSQRFYPSPLASDASSSSSAYPPSLGDAVHGEIWSKSESQPCSSPRTSEVSRGSSDSTMSGASGIEVDIHHKATQALSRRSSRLLQMEPTLEKKETCVYSLRPGRKRSYQDEDD
nr:hypothetical protein I302_00844 [Kwoniella bestiolae CBS 10118]OCF29342.1 hypothetical protein I302_00844 [Kwoniella bestiolae CBS 10118]